MKANDIRQSFIDYFTKNDHTLVPSSSLIPSNDPTLLFNNAGMNQFKEVFLGEETRDYKRAVSVQKCVRAGGKHNDLENVGFTARHHTFFEMLGNFSFGDYFKKEAIHFSWQWLTRELGLDPKRLYVSVHLSDDEAADIWHKQEGVPKDRIFRFDKDNFWRMGDIGPCGPSTEIFYDHGAEYGLIQSPYDSISAGEDRYIEIWNNVFMQHYENPPGTLAPLPKPSVDTGAGLERIVSVMQGVSNNYQTDSFTPLIEKACQIVKLNHSELLALEKKAQSRMKNENIKLSELGADYKQPLEQLAALRVVADHIRAISFLLADGVIPANEGRGYVLRRILRRAIRYGKKLNASGSLLQPLFEVLKNQMASVYPELSLRSGYITGNIQEEEDRFSHTLDLGTELLSANLKEHKSRGQKVLSGELVFKLYDTFGFPLDLTTVMAQEEGLLVDEADFKTRMEAAKKIAKASWKGKAANIHTDQIEKLGQDILQKHGPSQFLGYESTECRAQLLMLTDGVTQKESLRAQEQGFAMYDKTPFYAEGGGQVGDRGMITGPGFKAEVFNCTKSKDVFFHHIEVLDGELVFSKIAAAGEPVKSAKLALSQEHVLSVFASERRLTAANHSATHLLHAALRKTLGEHVTQAGSLVDAKKLRFDFTHNKALSTDEKASIENLVNQEIFSGTQVSSKITTQKQALSEGALALFGEKYGDEVRVIKMGEFSTELCGGTHVHRTSEIGYFKILSDSSIKSGVRRIEAITSKTAFEYLNKHLNDSLIARSALGIEQSWDAFLEDGSNKILVEVTSLKEQVKNLKKEMNNLKGSGINKDELLQSALPFTLGSDSGRLLIVQVPEGDRKLLADLTDQLMDKMKSGVIALLGESSSQQPASYPVLVAVSKNLTSSLAAGVLLKELSPILNSKGGGSKDFAQGATSSIDGWPKAGDYLKKRLGISG